MRAKARQISQLTVHTTSATYAFSEGLAGHHAVAVVLNKHNELQDSLLNQ